MRNSSLHTYTNAATSRARFTVLRLISVGGVLDSYVRQALLYTEEETHEYIVWPSSAIASIFSLSKVNRRAEGRCPSGWVWIVRQSFDSTAIPTGITFCSCSFVQKRRHSRSDAHTIVKHETLLYKLYSMLAESLWHLDLTCRLKLLFSITRCWLWFTRTSFRNSIYNTTLSFLREKQVSWCQFIRRQAVACQETSLSVPAALTKIRYYSSRSLKLSRTRFLLMTTEDCRRCNCILGLSLCQDLWASCPFPSIETNYSKADTCLPLLVVSISLQAIMPGFKEYHNTMNREIKRSNWPLTQMRANPFLSSVVSNRLKKASVTLTQTDKGGQ
jgi:hypothetical protein